MQYSDTGKMKKRYKNLTYKFTCLKLQGIERWGERGRVIGGERKERGRDTGKEGGGGGRRREREERERGVGGWGVGGGRETEREEEEEERRDEESWGGGGGKFTRHIKTPS